MCDMRTLVPIPDFLWDSGEVYGFDPEHPEFGIDDQGRRCLRLDDCIIPAIQALWAIGVMTVACCCGHSDGTNGVITIRTVAATQRIGTMLVRVEEYDRLRGELAATRTQLAHLADWVISAGGWRAFYYACEQPPSGIFDLSDMINPDLVPELQRLLPAVVEAADDR